MSRTPKAGDTCRDAGEGVCAGRTSKTNSRCRRVLLVIGMEDENLVHRRFDNRVDYILFSRYAKRNAQEIARIAQVVIWITERLTSRKFIGHCSESGNLRNQALARHPPLIGLIDVWGTVLEGG